MKFRFVPSRPSKDQVTTTLHRVTRDEGQDLIEYALLAAVLSVGCILSIQALAGGVIPFFDRVLAAFAAL